MFVQLASQLEFFELVKIGFEICGCYAYSITQDKFIKCKRPITSVKNLGICIKQIQNSGQKLTGLNNAYEALKIIRNNSYSPQETNLYIKLCANRKYGGFAIMSMNLNQKIQLSNKAKEIAGQQIIIPDISNCKTKIAIEYDSDEFHDNQLQNRKDKRRIDALFVDGWKVYSFVPGQVNNATIFYKMAREILKNNGQEYRFRGKKFKVLQNQLFQKL